MIFFWIALLIVFLILAFTLDTPEFLLFSLSSVAGALLSSIPGTAESVPLQVVGTVITGAVVFSVLRKRLRKLFRGEEIRPDAFNDSGKTAVVVEAIAPGKPGRVEVGGTTWNAVCVGETLHPGDTVLILERRDLTFLVTKQNPEEKEATWK